MYTLFQYEYQKQRLLNDSCTNSSYVDITNDDYVFTLLLYGYYKLRLRVHPCYTDITNDADVYTLLLYGYQQMTLTCTPLLYIQISQMTLTCTHSCYIYRYHK